MSDAIAIVGLACRFPGAPSASAFWKLLREGRDAIREVPGDRWDVQTLYSAEPNAPGKTNTRCAGFVDDVYAFDPYFFGISPREAAWMDPQQRLLLDVAWEALEDAGQTRQQLAESATGVFVGATANDYGFLLSHPEVVGHLAEPYLGTGISLNVLSGRLSYVFDLRGPSMTIDTACSSSLVAVHLACQSLKTGESDLALAAGVHLMLAPVWQVALSKMSASSPDGRCKTFDESADGYGRGEGAGVVVLKRLKDAVVDGDRIYAVVRGTAVNQDGRSNGLTAPNPRAQTDLIQRALAAANADPSWIQYVEVHGTGTSLGDPIELTALGEALTGKREREDRCAVGSVKTNIGHLEGAAGVASLIKVALSIAHAELPPSLGLKTLNPNIRLDRLPLKVQTTLNAWPKERGQRWAGISAFGWAGTNAHVVVSDAVPEVSSAGEQLQVCDSHPQSVEPELNQFLPLLLTAHSPEALQCTVNIYREFISETARPLRVDICFTAATRRTHHAHRAALLAPDADCLIRALDLLAQGERAPNSWTGVVSRRRQKLAFVFSGQGTVWAGMGRTLLARVDVFRHLVEEIDAEVRSRCHWSLLDLLSTDAGEVQTALRHTECAQVAGFVMQAALARLLQHYGIVADAVVGHSAGEIGAAYCAGVLTLAEAIELAHRRGVLMRSAEGRGRMLAVPRSATEAARWVERWPGRVSLAAQNGPHDSVLACDSELVNELMAALESERVRYRLLDVDYAFHSPQMEQAANALIAQGPDLCPQKASLRFMSSVNGTWAEGPDLDLRYWSRNVREPVLFADAISGLAKEGYGTFVELGPHSVLVASIVACLGDDSDPRSVIGTLARGRDDEEQVLGCLSALWARGYDVDWQTVFGGAGRCVSLPPYSFQREVLRVEGARWRGNVSTSIGDRPQSTETEAIEGMPPPLAYLPTWTEARPTEKASDPQGTWVLFDDETGVATGLRRRLLRSGASPVLVRPGPRFERVSDGYRLRPHAREDIDALFSDLAGDPIVGVVHLWACAVGPNADDVSALWDGFAFLGASLLHVIQAVGSSSQTVRPRVWVVTRGASSVTVPTAQVSSAATVRQASVWGLARVLRLERPDCWGGWIDLGGPDCDREVEAAWGELTRGDLEDQVAWRREKRYVARLEPIGLSENRCAVRADGTYLITGGTGALGLQVASWLLDRGATSIVLLSRTGYVEDERLRALKARGKSVTLLAGDVSREQDVKQVLGKIDEELPPLRGIFHTAGVLSDHTLSNQSWERAESVLAPKAVGAWNLHRLTEGRGLDLFVLFSSASSVLGSSGQASYVMASACLDALAHYRRSRELPALSINWSVWAGTGMGASLDEQLARRWRGFGVTPIEPKQGIAILDRLIQTPHAQVAVLPLAWSVYRSRMEALAGPQPLLSNVAADRANADASGSLLEKLEKTDEGRRRPMLFAHIRRAVAEVLGIDASRPMDPNKGFFDMGMDSLTVVELRNRLCADFGRTFSVNVLFNSPSVEALTNCLVEELFASDSKVTTPEGEDATTATTAELAQLVDQELLDLLGSVQSGEDGV